MGQHLLQQRRRQALTLVYVDRSQPLVTKMADFTIVGAMNDRTKLTQFGEACDAIIYQTPNVDSRVMHF